MLQLIKKLFCPAQPPQVMPVNRYDDHFVTIATAACKARTEEQHMAVYTAIRAFKKAFAGHPNIEQDCIMLLEIMEKQSHKK